LGRDPAPLQLPLPALSPDLRRSIEAVYRKLDEAVSRAGALCGACGACCRFDEYGHQLWLSALELAYLLDACGAAPAPRDGVCPYLVDGLCRAREARALGCRVFHCGLPAAEVEALGEEFAAMMVRVADESGLERTFGELLESLRAVAGAKPG
jgi:hypothetical protein